MRNFLSVRVNNSPSGLSAFYYVKINDEIIYRFLIFDYNGKKTVPEIDTIDLSNKFLFTGDFKMYNSVLFRDLLPADDLARETILKCVEMYFSR